MTKSNKVIAVLITFFISMSVLADTSNLNLDAKTLLRITGAKSVNELNNPNEEVHGIRIYYKHYRRCVIEQAKASYVYNKRDEFNTNRKLTKTEWNEFIKEQLKEKLNTLTKDNLLVRYPECELEVKRIIAQLYEFDKDWERWISWNTKNSSQEITPTQLVNPVPITVQKLYNPPKEVILKKYIPQPLRAISKNNERCLDNTISHNQSKSIGPDSDSCQHVKDIRNQRQ